jgi:hypothetical protein
MLTSRAHIPEDSPNAAHRMVTEILDRIRALVPFSNQGNNLLDNSKACLLTV